MDVWPTPERGKWTTPTCPYCGASRYTDAEDKVHGPTKAHYKTYAPETVPTKEEGDRFVYWIHWLESRGIVDDNVLHEYAGSLASREAQHKPINPGKQLHWANVEQRRRGKDTGILLNGEEDAEYWRMLNRDTGEVESYPAESAEDIEQEYINTENLITLRQQCDEVWAAIQKEGRPKKWGRDLTWEEALEATYPGDEASDEAKQEYDAIRKQKAIFRERLFRKLAAEHDKE